MTLKRMNLYAPKYIQYNTRHLYKDGEYTVDQAPWDWHRDPPQKGDKRKYSSPRWRLANRIVPCPWHVVAKEPLHGSHTLRPVGSSAVRQRSWDWCMRARKDRGSSLLLLSYHQLSGGAQGGGGAENKLLIVTTHRGPILVLDFSPRSDVHTRHGSRRD